MSNFFYEPEKDEESSNNKERDTYFNLKEGKISDTIGTGENAKDSFIYLTLKWSFTTGIILSILIVINQWAFREAEKVPDFIGDISTLWEILIPIITLALGYAFGKSKK